MSLHCVFCQVRDDVVEAAREAVLSDLAAFSACLEGVARFEHGPNRDFEQKSQAFQAGFVITFRDQAALERYAQHPRHQELGGQLCDLCVGGAAGIIVFDLETTAA